MEVLQGLMQRRRLPGTIRVDNGPEFSSMRLDQWACLNGVAAGLQPAGEAHGQRLHRGVQRTLPSGAPERELVPVPRGHCREGGILAKTLQWGKALTCHYDAFAQAEPQGSRQATGAPIL